MSFQSKSLQPPATRLQQEAEWMIACIGTASGWGPEAGGRRLPGRGPAGGAI
jgi:hypothetical protein